MQPRTLILLGTLIALAALGIAALGAALPGPTVPSCSGRPLARECIDGARIAGLALQIVGLGAALFGGIMAAVGLGRRAMAADAAAEAANLQGGDPLSPPDERAP